VKWTLPVAIAIMVSLLAPLASADDIRTYVGLSAGWSGLGEVPIKNDVLGTTAVAFAKGGGAFGAEAGFDSGVIRPSFRVDYRHNGIARVVDSGLVGVPLGPTDDIDMVTIMADLAIDIPVPGIADQLEFYLGGGFGAGGMGTRDIWDWEFAYSGFVGFYVPIFEPIGFELGYRYTGTTEGLTLSDEVGGVYADIGVHEVSLGVRWVFGGGEKLSTGEDE
jgi:hypothetical protein